MNYSAIEKDRLKRKYGPWAIVSGASSGIGLELAERLAEAGLNLVISSRNQAELENIAQRLTTIYAVEVKVVAADMSNELGIKMLIRATEELPVGLLVVSAGFGTSGLFIESDLDAEIDMVRVNCEALLHLTHHYSKLFAENRRGGIILMSSMVGFQGVPFAANYAATKAYVQSLAEALSVELKPYGVDMLAAAPGPVKSKFGERASMAMNMALTPAQIGVPILRALGRQSTVLPGLLTKFLVGSLRTVPRWGKVLIMKRVMGGMTGQKL